MSRRLEILRAAGKEFRVRGFAETGMRDIAAAADLSPGNLYNYFRGKQELLFFCQDNSLGRLLSALKKNRRLQASMAKRLEAVVVSHVKCLLDEVEGSAAHLLTVALPAQMQRSLLAKRDRYEGGVRELIAAGVRSGEFTCADPALAARAMLGAMNWSVTWFNPDGPMTAAEIAEGLAVYLVQGLLTKQNRSRNEVSRRAPQLPIRSQISRRSIERRFAGDARREA